MRVLFSATFLVVTRLLALVFVLGCEYIELAKLDELMAKKLLWDGSRSSTYDCLTAVYEDAATTAPPSIKSLQRLATFSDLRISVLVLANSGNCLYSYLRSCGILMARGGLVVPEGGRLALSSTYSFLGRASRFFRCFFYY